MNKITKLSKVGGEILPMLNEKGAGIVIKPSAPAIIATQIIEAMQLDSNDYLEDYTTDEFKEKALKAIQRQSKMAATAKELDQKKKMADVALAEANVGYTNAQSKNTMDDNSKQLAVSIDKHFQEWADLTIKASKEGTQLPEHPSYDQILMMAKQVIQPQPQQPQQQMNTQEN
jgi:hypothetical protein